MYSASRWQRANGWQPNAATWKLPIRYGGAFASCMKRGEPIGKPLFAAVGKEFGVSGTVAEEIYYDLIHESHEMAAEDEDETNNRK